MSKNNKLLALFVKVSTFSKYHFLFPFKIFLRLLRSFAPRELNRGSDNLFFLQKNDDYHHHDLVTHRKISAKSSKKIFFLDISSRKYYFSLSITCFIFMLNILLYLGIAYFIFMSIAHFFSIKLPFLFVYYDTPFYEYQDKIISFSVVAYIFLFIAAIKHNDLGIFAAGLMFITFCGLSYINISKSFNALIKEKRKFMYWIQTILLGFYSALLFIASF